MCLGGSTGSLTAGPKCVTPGGVIDVDCSFGCVQDSECSGGFVCTNHVCVDPDVFAGFSNCGTAGTYYGEEYPTVEIGSQCWLAKNINRGTYIGYNHTAVGPNGIAGDIDDCVDLSGDQYWSCQGYAGIQKFCPDNVESNCATYGGLYEWAEAMKLPYNCNDNDMQYTCSGSTCTAIDSNTSLEHSECGFPNPEVTRRKGICPTGWHLPTENEWLQLQTTLGGTTVVGGQIKEAGTSHWLSPNTGATNSSLFTALPAGERVGWYGDGTFNALGYNAKFWPSTPAGLSLSVRYNSAGADHNGIFHFSGISVRCLKD